MTTADAIVRIWRSAWAWMPVDRGKGWFRLAWVVVSIIGLTALLAAGLLVLTACRRAWTDPTAAVTAAPRELDSGGGVPRWMAASLNFCPRCGSSLSFGEVAGEDRHRLSCPACGHVLYVNPRLVVTTLPVTDAGEIVLIRRGHRARGGEWAQPGGFLEVDETVHEAAIRETLEETGLLVEPGEIVGLYTRLEAAVVTHRVRGHRSSAATDADARGDRGPRLSPRGHPLARDRLPDDHLGAPRLARAAPPGRRLAADGCAAVTDLAPPTTHPRVLSDASRPRSAVVS